MGDYILACDEGTSSARSIVFDREGNQVASSQTTITSSFPYEGWVEQDALEIWQAQIASVRECLAAASIDATDIHAIGITNQRETVLIWDRESGAPVAPAITWQCRRTADTCAAINATDDATWISASTGLKIDPYFSATKLQWLLDRVEGIRGRAEAGELAFGTIDSWLVYNFTGGTAHLIDRTNASRTLLMNLATGEWDPELLRFFDVPPALLPTICESSGALTTSEGDLLGSEIPIAGLVGDQQGALVGQHCLIENTAKLTYGTGAFLLVHTGDQIVSSRSGLLTTAAASLDSNQAFALEGSVFSAGSTVQWIRDELGLIETATDTEKIANQIDDTQGVYLVPAFEGLGAPYWDAHARAAFTGLSRAADRRHLVRAALEAIAYQVYDLVQALEQDTSTSLTELRVDGGAANNDFLMQFQADLLNAKLGRPRNLESTALGAAMLAAHATDFGSIWGYEVEKTFEPTMSESTRQAKLGGWHDAVRRVRS